MNFYSDRSMITCLVTKRNGKYFYPHGSNFNHGNFHKATTRLSFFDETLTTVASKYLTIRANGMNGN